MPAASLLLLRSARRSGSLVRRAAAEAAEGGLGSGAEDLGTDWSRVTSECECRSALVMALTGEMSLDFLDLLLRALFCFLPVVDSSFDFLLLARDIGECACRGEVGESSACQRSGEREPGCDCDEPARLGDEWDTPASAVRGGEQAKCSAPACCCGVEAVSWTEAVERSASCSLPAGGGWLTQVFCSLPVDGGWLAPVVR
mmetsp:Transcript_40722/g.102519  ORF Transcript_40722/g.102519 Transcript_40722/m.102519 type:complete len:200 (-) Transcript_40722:1474-2073(-)